MCIWYIVSVIYMTLYSLGDTILFYFSSLYSIYHMMNIYSYIFFISLYDIILIHVYLSYAYIIHIWIFSSLQIGVHEDCLSAMMGAMWSMSASRRKYGCQRLQTIHGVRGGGGNYWSCTPCWLFFCSVIFWVCIAVLVIVMSNRKLTNVEDGQWFLLPSTDLVIEDRGKSANFIGTAACLTAAFANNPVRGANYPLKRDGVKNYR